MYVGKLEKNKVYKITWDWCRNYLNYSNKDRLQYHMFMSRAFISNSGCWSLCSALLNLVFYSLDKAQDKKELDMQITSIMENLPILRKNLISKKKEIADYIYFDVMLVQRLLPRIYKYQGLLNP